MIINLLIPRQILNIYKKIINFNKNMHKLMHLMINLISKFLNNDLTLITTIFKIRTIFKNNLKMR